MLLCFSDSLVLLIIYLNFCLQLFPAFVLFCFFVFDCYAFVFLCFSASMFFRFSISLIVCFVFLFFSMCFLCFVFAFLCFSIFPLLLFLCFSVSLIICFVFLFLSFRLLLFPALIACCFSLVDCFPLPLLSFCFSAFVLLRCSALTLCFCIIAIAITSTIAITMLLSAHTCWNPAASKGISDPGRGLADQLLLGAHICVLQNKSTKKSIEGFVHSSTLADQVLLWLHPRVKGWPTNCCCGHTHVCFCVNQLRVTTNCCCEHIHMCGAE